MNPFLVLGVALLVGVVFGFARVQWTKKQFKMLRDKSAHVSQLLYKKEKELAAAKLMLKERSKESNEIARTLVRRDLELTETNERLRELDTIKSEFVSVAAHQLRTPLSATKWALGAFLDEDFGKVTKEQKATIERM
mgnify:CR=1 FL=1